MANETGRLHQLIDWTEKRLNLTEMVSLLTMFGLFYTELNTSKPLSEAVREALAKPLPAYSRWPRVMGLLVLILFLFELGTGLLLAFYYRPTPQESYESILIIARDVRFGWFVRQMHFWGAQLLLVILIARLIRFFFRGHYRPPRELIWITAALLLVTATHLDFTGRFLASNNDFYWSSHRAMELLFSIPIMGVFFSFVIHEIEDYTFTLSRFYFMHILMLPTLFWGLLYLSFSGIRRIGLTEIKGEEHRPARETFPAHLYNLLIIVVFIFGILVTFSVLVPVPFGEPIDYLETPGNLRIPWYLLAPYGLVEIFPSWMPISGRSLILLVVLMVFILLPFLDRRSNREPSQRRRIWIVNFVLLAVWIFFTFYGAFLDIGGG